MFRKIILSYLPDDNFSQLSPIKFHLKLLSPKLFYWINLKYWFENRRLIQADSRLSFFDNYNIAFDNMQDENFYYWYKNFSLLNWYDNYNIYVILPVISLIILNKYKDEQFFIENLKPILYGVSYTVFMFFARFKEFPYEKDKDNFDFFIKLLEKVIFQIEYSHNVKQNIKELENKIKFMIEILKTNIDFLMFIYKLSKELYNFYNEKSFSDIILYEYLASSSLLDFPNEKEIKQLLKQNSKKIYIKRNTFYLDVDIITILNLILQDVPFLSYITNEDNLDYVANYFVDSLSHIDSIDLKLDIKNIVDKVYNFTVWWNNFIDSLKEYNSENVDLNVEPWLWFEQIQEMMSKEMMDSVKQISVVNEQFLDLYVYFVTRRLNNASDTYQFELLYKNEINSKVKIEQDMYFAYKILDTNYFTNSYFYKNRKAFDNAIHYYDFDKKVLPNFIYKSAFKILFSEFQKKSNREYIPQKNYIDIIKEYFSKDLQTLVKKDIKKGYLKKYFKLKKLSFTEEQIKNFKSNIYFPDFIVFCEFLELSWIKVTEDLILTVSRIKDSLFGYLVFRKINWFSKEYEDFYLEWIGVHAFIDFNVEEFYKYFDEKYPKFLNVFTSAKQNQKFVNILKNTMEKYTLKHLFFYDNMRIISYYNKRIFKI